MKSPVGYIKNCIGNGMEVEDIVKRKLDMELKIAKLVSDEVCQFSTDTGLSPSNIYIRLVSVQTMGEDVEHSIVAGCTIDVNL